MAINPNLETISSGYNISKINTNFQAIDTALQDAVSRSGQAPNQMDADFDMNGNDILNVDNIDVSVLTIDGVPIVPGNVDLNPDSLVPTGGTDGQVLTKQSSTDYDTAWEDVPEGIPAGGTDGQVLTKQSGTDFDADWEDVVQGREKLLANRTYYVRTDGSDTNNGLTNTSGGAFLTLQKAINTYLALDLAGYAVTIQIADGTYTNATVAYWNPPGATNAAPLTIQGNSGDTDGVIISTTSANGLYLAGIRANLKWFKVQTTTGGDCIIATDGAALTLTGLVFGPTASSHVYCTNNSRVTINASYEVVGGGVSHFHCTSNSAIAITTGTTTLTGTPVFSSYYLGLASGGSVEYVNGTAWSGTFTGKRFLVHAQSVLFTAGQLLNWIPGTIEGEFYGGGIVTDNVGEKDYQVIPDAGNVLANVNTFQAFFPAASDVFAMQLNTTYRVTGWFTFVRTAGTTSHDTTFQWGGTLGAGGTAWWKFDFSNPNSGAAGAVSRRHTINTNNVIMATANTSATEEITVSFEGIVRSGSTTALLQPGFIYSAAPGGAPTVKAGEMRFQAVGTNAFSKNGAWS